MKYHAENNRAALTASELEIDLLRSEPSFIYHRGYSGGSNFGRTSARQDVPKPRQSTEG